MKILILGASELQLPLIEEANRMGISTIVADYDENAIGKDFSDKFYNVSTLDFKKIDEIVSLEKVDGIATICSDRPMTIIAKIGEKYNLRTISYSTALKATNKAYMRKALEKYNVPIPKFHCCLNKEEYMKASTEFDFPFIVKPSNNSGSRGIFLVQKRDEIENAYQYSLNNTTDGIVLIEEFLEGPEVSVEIFTFNGEPEVIQITDKITTGAPHFVELGHSQPTQIECTSVIKEISINAVKALNITNGPAHVELKITRDGPKIIELGARLGGDHITTDLVPLSTNINMVKLVIEDALNLPLTREKKIKSNSIIRYFTNNSKKYANIFSNNKFKSLISFKIIQDLSIDKVMSSNDRSGYFIMAHPSKIVIDEELDKINKLVEEEFNVK